MFKLVNPYVAIGALVGLIGCFLFGMKVGRDMETATQARIEARIKATEEAAEKAAAREIAKIEVINKTTKQVLEREIVEKPVYRDCRNTDAGLQSINSALQNRPLPASDSVVPGVNPSSGP